MILLLGAYGQDVTLSIKKVWEYWRVKVCQIPTHTAIEPHLKLFYVSYTRVPWLRNELMYGRISVRSSRNLRPFRGVTLRIRRYKKRGHKHELYMSVNTKGEKVERCKICKYHTKTFSYNITPGYCFLSTCYVVMETTLRVW